MQTMIYRRIAKVTVAAATVISALALFGERQSLDRYQSVIDRQMFGPLPPNFDPTKSPSEISAKDERAKEQELTKEQEQVKSAIHFSVINVTPAGDTAVGFTDNSDSKNPKHYYLKVGESRDGWTVKEADPLKAEMTIAKGEIEVTLTIGGNSANGGTTKSTSTANAPRGGAAGGRSNLLGGRMGGSAGGGRGLGSLRERRAQREQQKAAEKQAVEAEKARMAEEREKERAQREAEKEAERAEREKEREETQKKLAEMAEELKRQREESAAKKESEGGEDQNNKEGNVEQ